MFHFENSKSYMQSLITKSVGMALALAALNLQAADRVSLKSPDRQIEAQVLVKNQQLYWRVSRDGQTVLEDSRLGVTVDGIDLGSGVTKLKAGKVTQHREEYRMNGEQSLLEGNDRRVSVTVLRDGEPFVVELRAFDSGVAFRYVVPGQGGRKVSGESTAWKLPAKSRVWFRTNEQGDYTGRAEQQTIGSLTPGKEIVGPLLVELPGKAGFVGVTEADPWQYSGLSFRMDSADTLAAQFKYDSEWTVAGGAPTAWRVLMAGADLNGVMQGQRIVDHVSRPSDPRLYPQGAATPWIKPGRSAWSWLDPHARARGGVTVEHQKRFIDMAAEFGFEYNTVDDGWEMWPDKWKTLAELAQYAKSKNVKLIAWKDTADGDRVPDPANNYANLRAFLDKIRDAGLAGIKIDFLWGNPLIGEGTKTLQFMPVVYELAAERQLLVNFHGAVKPTGQMRTWPNAITQEPVLGMEAGAAPADAAIVAFLCGLAGPCDYTPGLFAPGQNPELRGNTTWANQLAMGIVFNSPMLHWASGPELARNAFPPGSIQREVYQSIPATWDETLVLDVSQVGSVAAFTRRKGNDWFVGIINGNEKESVTLADVALPFLKRGNYNGVTLSDGAKPDEFQTGVLSGVNAARPMQVKLAPGGGFVARFRPAQQFNPGALWLDDKGVHINAHGGGILFHQGVYYWFGEHKIEGGAGNVAQVGVHVYSSTNLYQWKDEGIALKVSDDPTSDIAKGNVIERPKVIYNRNTGKFVMWFHLEKDPSYSASLSGVAVADHVTGPYTFIESFRPNAGIWPRNVPKEFCKPLSPEEAETVARSEMSGSYMADYCRQDYRILRRDFAGGQMARDMTLFVDDDGKAYHIYSSEVNSTLHISLLTDDYLKPSGKYVRAFPLAYNEAPALFKHRGKYYLFSSGCTGWAPNAGRLAVADSIWGPWQALGNPCVGPEERTKITFDSQSTYVLPVQGKKNAFIFMADRWRPENAIDGRYVWLPVQFDQTGKPFLAWLDQWDMNVFNRP